MKMTTKLRLVGVVILVFNCWLIGAYSIAGAPVLLMTFGFAIVFEYLVVKPLAKTKQSEDQN